MKLHPYLNYGGNCKEAFQFYEQHLGGKITMMMTHGEQPDPNAVAPEWKDAILYAHMIIGETELMANDVPPDRFQPMRSAYLSLYGRQHRRCGTDPRPALRRRRDLHAHAGDLLRPPLQHVARQIRHVVDDHSPAPHAQ